MTGIRATVDRIEGELAVLDVRDALEWPAEGLREGQAVRLVVVAEDLPAHDGRACPYCVEAVAMARLRPTIAGNVLRVASHNAVCSCRVPCALYLLEAAAREAQP